MTYFWLYAIIFVVVTAAAASFWMRPAMKEKRALEAGNHSMAARKRDVYDDIASAAGKVSPQTEDRLNKKAAEQERAERPSA